MLGFAKRLLRIGGGVIPTVRLALSVLRNEGVNGIRWRLNVARRMVYADGLPFDEEGVKADYNRGYEDWIRKNESPRVNAPSHGPRISVLIPLRKPSLDWLRKAIDSVVAQSYEHWELWLVADTSENALLSDVLREWTAEDARIKVYSYPTNGHISAATNDAFKLIAGDFVTFLNQADELHPDALAHVAVTLLTRPDAEVVYSDEDKLDEQGRRHHPYFKPQFNPVLFLAQNMIAHLGAYRTSTLREIGGLRERLERAQNWDLAWRVIEAKGAEKVVHIPKVLYHCRELPSDTANDAGEKSRTLAASVQVVHDHLDRTGRKAAVTPSERVPGMVRVQFEVPKPEPVVSIVIPTRDRKDLLELCTRSLFAKTAYRNYELIVVDNGTQAPDALVYLDELRKNPMVKVIREDIPFNFSRLNNLAVAQAQGEYILMLNNDIELTHESWLHEMMSWAAQPEVGCVGAKLWYPNGTLQHGGVILNDIGLAGHAHRGISKTDNGYMGRAALPQNFSAVTGACLLIKRGIYEEVGGLDEQLAVAYNDIDFCLRVQAAGYQNVWTPYAEMVHHESATRGVDSAGPGRARLETEVALMRERWQSVLADDPAYSPNLTRFDEGFHINLHD